ncbi:helix-turn-helix domain-containing protein [Pseudooceanicola marinus]|uniref:helix-turn-helix domain-containing protein n=1 Tax=Pseudooceanicola marinus TaxID=396013 RepID=UPI00117A0C45|nr:helix-turn-helix transcriptional regulator [Pseudooceanicola marinus]
MTLKIRIRELRKERGLTLAALAGMVGISTPHLSDIERGKKNLNNHLIMRVAEALDVEPQKLISGPASSDFAEFSEKLEALSEADRARVLDFVNALLASRKDS